MNRLHLTYLLLFFYSLIISNLSLAQKIDRQGKDFALFFAVKDYDNPGWTDLRNPINDAQAIATELEEIYGFMIEMHENPTWDQIGEILKSYQKKQFHEDGQLFIYFSGHGLYSETTEKGYFIPRDGKEEAKDELHRSHFDYSDIAGLVNAIPCKHILLTIDACSSGAFQSNGDKSGRGSIPKSQQYAWVIDRLEKYKSRQFITSGGKKRERTKDGNKNSPLTIALLQGLRGRKYKGFVSAVELQANFQGMIPEPRLGEFGNHEVTGNFIFITKNTSIGTLEEEPDNSNSKGNTKPFEPISETTISSSDFHEMILVKGGTFQMGNNEGAAREKPVHKVSLSNFYIGKYEVTNAQFTEFLNAKGNKTEGGATWINLEGNDTPEKCRIQKRGGRFVVEAGYENHPVIYVSWHGARAYCKWAGGRLPTEAEWEYAARGGQLSKNFKYAGSNTIDQVAVYRRRNDSDGSAKLHPKGSKSSNELGLYDMSGNVWEWCQDAYDEEFYSKPEANNSNPVNKNYEAIRQSRALRGGSWFTFNTRCSVSFRMGYKSSRCAKHFGFRLCRDVP